MSDLADAFVRLSAGATQGAIGGAVCGAAFGIIAAMVKPDAVQVDTTLPIDAPYLRHDAEMLTLVLEVLVFVSPRQSQLRTALVANVDELCKLSQQGKSCPGALAKAQRSYGVVRRIADMLPKNSGSDVREATEQLTTACDNIVHNLCLE